MQMYIIMNNKDLFDLIWFEKRKQAIKAIRKQNEAKTDCSESTNKVI